MKIVVLDGYTLNPGDNPWAALEDCGDLIVFENSTEDEVVARGHDADVLIVNKVNIARRDMDKLPHLKFIAVTATGFDCVDVDAARDNGILVSNVPIYGTDSVAQFVFALLLELTHGVGAHDAAVRDGEWARRGDFSFWLSPQIELARKTMGIVGFGRIGQRVAELAKAFGMPLLVHTRTPREDADVRFVSLPVLAAEADVISLNCPLTEESRGMVNTAFLDGCKNSALLINTGRGPLVVEADLASALKSGAIAGAAVDVASSEPITSDNPLLTAPNCIITPHMAWATLDARKRLMHTTVENVAAFQRAQPQNVVN